jgi:signal transduction histidine kinase
VIRRRSAQRLSIYLGAKAAGVTLTVMPMDAEIAIDGDRHVLAAVMANLLQNAFKFTEPHSTVTLRVGVNAERVLIEVQDECGGLPGGVRGSGFFGPSGV